VFKDFVKNEKYTGQERKAENSKFFEILISQNAAEIPGF
jgi:hypothetical protein